MMAECPSKEVYKSKTKKQNLEKKEANLEYTLCPNIKFKIYNINI